MLGCGNANINNSNDVVAKRNSNSIVIDTIMIEEHDLKDVLFRIEESKLPKINGLSNKIYENQLNDIFSINFNLYVDSVKLERGRPHGEYDELSPSSIPASVNSSFEVLTLNDSLISIVQFFVTFVGGGGNSWLPSSKVINCDLKNRSIFKNSDFGFTYNNIDLINNRIKEYYDKTFPEDKKSNTITYPLIKNKTEFVNLNFGLRNDSIMLVMEAYPLAHFSYGTYIIPIDNWKKN